MGSAVRSILNTVRLLRIFSQKTLQNFQLVQLELSLRETYSFHACNLDKNCNLDSVIDEGVHFYEDADTLIYYVMDKQMDFHHGKHDQGDLVLAKMYNHLERIQCRSRRQILGKFEFIKYHFSISIKQLEKRAFARFKLLSYLDSEGKRQ